MKRMLAAVAVLGLITLVSSAVAADPSGNWNSTAAFGTQSLESTFRLRLDSEGNRLTGWFRGPVGEVSPLTNAQAKDRQISFSVRSEINNQLLTIKYSGKLSGDTITGKAQAEQDGQVLTGDWTATRQK